MAVLKRFRDLPSAELASATLSAAGIENSLADTCTIGLLWTYSSALGWIRLQVDDRDLDTAYAVLEPATVLEAPAAEEETEPVQTCPSCGSSDLALEKGARRTLALMLLTAVPIWFWRTRLRCGACGFSRAVRFTVRPDLAVVMLVAAVTGVSITLLVYFLLGVYLSKAGI